LYWLHPLVWVAFRRLSLEAERAADDAVVRSAEHTEYAEQLVSLAGRISKAQAQAALGMANRSDLSARVSAILDGSQRRGRAGWRPTASALGVAGLVVLALAPVRAVTLAKKQTAEAAQTPGSQSITQGKPINKVQPPYPEIAKRAGAHGAVKVQVMISEDGRVMTAEILSGHVLLRDASRQAALQWRFQPTVQNGVAVPVTGVITFNFKPNRKKRDYRKS